MFIDVVPNRYVPTVVSWPHFRPRDLARWNGKLEGRQGFFRVSKWLLGVMNTSIH